MSDLISREAVLALPIYNEKNLYGNIIREYVDIEDVKQLPPIQPEPHWIPVTEQEPKESGKYLVTAIISFIPDHVDDPDTFEAVTTANYLADIRGSIKWWGNNVEKVLAWMPLPEPFKGVTDGND